MVFILAPLQKFILIVYISQLEKTTRYVRISNVFFIILSDGYDLMAYDFRDGISIKKEEKVLAKAIGGDIIYTYLKSVLMQKRNTFRVEDKG